MVSNCRVHGAGCQGLPPSRRCSSRWALPRWRSTSYAVLALPSGDINFVVNAEPHSQAEQFASLHGPSVCGMAFRVSDAGKAQQYAIGKGAKPFVGKIGPMELNIPAIYGIGESTLFRRPLRRQGLHL